MKTHLESNNKTKPCSRWLVAASAVTILHTGGSIAIADSTLEQQLGRAQSPVDAINAEAAKAEIVVERLRGNVAVLTGSGGNIGVFTSAQGKLMIDGGIAVSRPRLSRAIEQLGPGPIKYVFNTHWHWDHTDGNGWLHQAGATIIAHENTRKHLSEVVRVDDWNHTFPVAPRRARPTETVETVKTLSFGGETLQVIYYGPCHTDGDVYVYLEQADILFAGDTFWNGMYPFIDIATGGSIDGMIRAADTNIALATDHTIIVGGHGPVGNRAQLIEYRDMLVQIRANVLKLKREGNSMDQAVAGKPTAAYDAKWGQFVIGPTLFTQLVYRGI